MFCIFSPTGLNLTRQLKKPLELPVSLGLLFTKESMLSLCKGWMPRKESAKRSTVARKSFGVRFSSVSLRPKRWFSRSRPSGPTRLLKDQLVLPQNTGPFGDPSQNRGC